MTDKPAAETITMDFSHDYPNDTHLTCSKEGDLVHLHLAFDFEDPDMGTEEMEYNSAGGESFSEIIHDALSDLSSYLDRQDTSSNSRENSFAMASMMRMTISGSSPELLSMLLKEH